MFGIKENIEIFKEKGFDDQWVLEIEYRKTKFWLERIFFRTEKTLIVLQSKEDQDQKRINEVEKTHNELLFILGQFQKMELKIKELQDKNRMLEDRFKFISAKK
jgi:hypothetical protein